MMKNLFPIIFISTLLTSCVPTWQFVKPNSDKIIESNKAKIYVMRTGNYAYDMATNIFQGKKLMGRLGPKSYLSWEVDASKGDVVISNVPYKKNMVKISPEAGKTYYIRQKMNYGYIFGTSKLFPINEIEGKESLSILKEPKIKERKKDKVLNNKKPENLPEAIY